MTAVRQLIDDLEDELGSRHRIARGLAHLDPAGVTDRRWLQVLDSFSSGAYASNGSRYRGIDEQFVTLAITAGLGPQHDAVREYSRACASFAWPGTPFPLRGLEAALVSGGVLDLDGWVTPRSMSKVSRSRVRRAARGAASHPAGLATYLSRNDALGFARTSWYRTINSLADGYLLSPRRDGKSLPMREEARRLALIAQATGQHEPLVKMASRVPWFAEEHANAPEIGRYVPYSGRGDMM